MDDQQMAIFLHNSWTNISHFDFEVFSFFGSKKLSKLFFILTLYSYRITFQAYILIALIKNIMSMSWTDWKEWRQFLSLGSPGRSAWLTNSRESTIAMSLFCCWCYPFHSQGRQWIHFSTEGRLPSGWSRIIENAWSEDQWTQGRK